MPQYQDLSEVLPPLILGVGVFNHQFNKDPLHLPTNEIVYKALSYGICAFDTSPYYGPSEEILGKALALPEVKKNFPREDYYILTKVGRISNSEFDYSPSWIRHSVNRSLARLNTTYLDVVYCHDVEFVSKEEVLIAVKELRKIRDELGVIKYVGVCGYPIDLLCELAELVLKETGEPLDIVQSYCHQTLQNTRLNRAVARRFKEAGVKLVPNASPLGMGLMRSQGVPVGDMGDFHPSSPGLREACMEAAKICEAQDERLETVALRFAIDTWARNGSEVGSNGPLPLTTEKSSIKGTKLGVTVLGCSFIDELEQAIDTWRSIVREVGEGNFTPKPMERKGEWSTERIEKVKKLAVSAREALGRWVDNVWDSPGKDFVNTLVRQ
jgi:D-arabinose 1-dehydrogenase